MAKRITITETQDVKTVNAVEIKGIILKDGKLILRTARGDRDSVTKEFVRNGNKPVVLPDAAANNLIANATSMADLFSSACDLVAAQYSGTVVND